MNHILKGCVVAVAAVLFGATAVCEAQSVMTHHVREVVSSGKAQAMGRLPSNQVLQLDIVLQLRDRAGLESLLKQLYDPASPVYRQFLTVPEFTARFGPTVQDYETVLRFATTYGFQVVGGTRDGMDMQVKGTVANIEAAFHVNMRTYQHPTESRTFYSPDVEPRMDLPFNLWHISGLDNYSIPQPLYESKADYAQAHGITPDQVVTHATTGSGPSASFLGSDMRAAYYGATTQTGQGQNLGLLEYYGTDLTDLQTYYANVGQTYPGGVITLLSTDGTSTSCVYRPGHCDDTEQTLDMTQALGMAPGLASLVMYVGSTDTAMISAMTTHSPLPTTIGCSWGWTPADPTTLDPYFEKMAAQGQNFFAASGDHSTWTASGSSSAWPADDAYVVSVGGTDLTTQGAGGSWASETAWVDSGGGISPDGIAIPAWQQLSGVINGSNQGSTTLRNGPDVSANANFSFYVCADQKSCTANSYGGTSFAAPMWAGYIALVNQQLAAGGKPTIGFINPTIYNQNVGSGYATDFHDITSGTSGSYSAVTGYDLVTGWGSPNTGLINALAGATQPTGFSLSASPTSVSVAAGSGGSSTITGTVTGTLGSTISLSATVPTGWSAVTFNPTSLADTGTSSSTMSFTVPAGTATGTYTIKVTGTSGSTVETTTVTVSVTGSTGSFTMGVSPTSVTVTKGGSTSATVTTAVSGSFSSSISLSASGAGRGVSISFSPASITGAGSSTMTIKAARNAATGNFTITITGSGGGVTQQAAVALTVN